MTNKCITRLKIESNMGLVAINNSMLHATTNSMQLAHNISAHHILLVQYIIA